MQSTITSQIHSWVNGYWLYTPDGWDGKTKLPCFIFIHGVGEVGTDINLVLNTGLPRLINQTKTFPVNAMVFMPQFRNAWPGDLTVQSVIDFAKKLNGVDLDRIYLTGLSMGGAAILDWSERGTIKDIAAMYPVCPQSVPTALKAQRLTDGNMPMYFCHGVKDPTAAYSNSVNWLKAVNDLGINPQAKLFSLPNGAHEVWDVAYAYTGKDYDGMSLYQHALQYSRGAALPPAATVVAEFIFPNLKYTLYSDNTWK